MKRTFVLLTVFFMFLASLNGMVMALGPLYTIGTQNGFKLVQMYDCVKLQTEEGVEEGAIVYISDSDSKSDEDVVYTIEYKSKDGYQIVDILGKETKKQIIE